MDNIKRDHSTVFRKIDENIYQIVVDRYSNRAGSFVDSAKVVQAINRSEFVALVDTTGKMYFSTHPNYGWA